MKLWNVLMWADIITSDKKLDQLLKQGAAIMATVAQIQTEIVELKGEVTQMSDVITAASTAFAGLSAIIASLKQQLADAIAAGADPVKLQEIVDGLNEVETTMASKRQELAAAITANTPAA